MGSPSVRPLSESLLNDPSPDATSPGPCNGMNISQDRCKKREDLLAQGKRYRNAMTISMLTDNVLLEIFDFCRLNHNQNLYYQVWKWHLLVQVCRRWRQIIFASPRHLDLKLLCTDGTPVRKYLGIWPAIPINMQYGHYGSAGRSISPNDEDNAIAALEHPDRVRRVRLDVEGSHLGKIAKVMQVPFPVLTRLSISSDSEDEDLLILPGKFLGESAPCLREFELFSISFPALPTLLLSAIDLVELRLCNIPPTGYISPEAMVAHSATLPRLEILDIGFQSVTSHPDDQMLRSPETRTVLPALHHLSFSGVCGYSEDFLARIDTPQLDSIVVLYLDQVADFEVSQFFEFINRSETLKDTLSSHCQIMLDDYDGAVDFCIDGATSDEAERWDPNTGIYVCIACEEEDRGVVDHILHLTHVLSSWNSPILSNMAHFTICESSISEDLDELEDLDDIEWLQLLRLFPSVQTLFVSGKLAGHMSRVLEDIAEVTITEVLPALGLLCLEDQPLSSVDKFIAVRQDSGRPVTIVNTKKKFEKRLKSYPKDTRESSSCVLSSPVLYDQIVLIILP